MILIPTLMTAIVACSIIILIMNETEPLYFKEFKEDIKRHIDVSINDLAMTIQNTMVTKKDFEYEISGIKNEISDMKNDISELKDDIRVMKDDMKGMATKEDVKEILSHIGRYEVRAQNTEDILLKDHKPRIIDLEKEVFA